MQIENLGPYRIDRLLGQGGMGAVYEATHRETGEVAAVKVLPPLMNRHGHYRDRFDAEIESLKKLRHPNIVQLLGYGEQDGQVFYAMELVRGRSLQQELFLRKSFTWPQVVHYGIQICAALKIAHDSGIIHRDIKPANLLLAENDCVKLLDFGIAKLFGGTELTAVGGMIGTADYMAPEQAEGKPVTLRCDLYSLGSVLYALLAGRPPFVGKTAAQVIHSLRFDAPRPVREFASNTPPELEQLIATLLSKDPQQRPATAFVVANRLRALDAAANAPTRDDTQVMDKSPNEMPASSSITKLSPATSSGAPAVAPQHETGERIARTDADPVKNSKARVTEVLSESNRSGLAPHGETRFVSIEEERQLRDRELTKRATANWIEWTSFGGIVILLIAIAIALWSVIRPPTADAIYTQIKSVAAVGDISQLREVEPQIEQFLSRFPTDSRCEELKQYQQELAIDRRAKRFARPAVSFGNGSQLSTMDRAYLEAMRLEETDLDRCVEMLQQIVDLFTDPDVHADGPSAKTVELATTQLAKLQPILQAQHATDLEVLRARLQSAIDHRQSDPESARRIARSLIGLYENKPWAADVVAQARSLLESETPADRAP